MANEPIKMLIITDSHSSAFRDAVSKYILKRPWGQATWDGPRHELVQGKDVNGHTIEILGLMGRTGYNFANHINILNGKDYAQYQKIMFLGFNDLRVIFERGHSVTESVDKYINSAVEVFGKENLIFLTPLIDYGYDMKNIETHKEYTKYMRQSCQSQGIRCCDIYSIIGEKSKDDLIDPYHLHTKHFLPIYEHLGVI